MFKRKYFIYKNLFVVFNILFLVKVVLILHDLIKIRNAPVQSRLETCGVNFFWLRTRLRLLKISSLWLRFRKFLFSDSDSDPDSENFQLLTPTSTLKNSEIFYWKWTTSTILHGLNSKIYNSKIFENWPHRI
jgi:hypothetical protein